MFRWKRSTLSETWICNRNMAKRTEQSSFDLIHKGFGCIPWSWAGSGLILGRRWDSLRFYYRCYGIIWQEKAAPSKLAWLIGETLQYVVFMVIVSIICVCWCCCCGKCDAGSAEPSWLVDAVCMNTLILDPGCEGPYSNMTVVKPYGQPQHHSICLILNWQFMPLVVLVPPPSSKKNNTFPPPSWSFLPPASSTLSSHRHSCPPRLLVAPFFNINEAFTDSSLTLTCSAACRGGTSFASDRPPLEREPLTRGCSSVPPCMHFLPVAKSPRMSALQSPCGAMCVHL